MYIVLSGARQNLGDFLIGERCRALLHKHKPGEKLIQFDAAENLTEHLDLVNNSKGVIVMGGPGYRPQMFPNIYRLTPNLKDLKVPIILFGMGWKGDNSDLATIKNYRFDKPSLSLLNYSMDNTEYLSCRDFYTWSVLREHGLKNILMTGCPAWYELESIHSEYSPPLRFKEIAYTPPAQPKFRKQSILVAETLKRLFPNAQLSAFFHHGYTNNGKCGNEGFFQNQRMIRDALANIKIDCVDVSGDIQGIVNYKSIDLHVGYRVHAHIDCLSRRKTSILIHEDGRGAGADDALGVPGIDAWKINCFSSKTSLRNRILGNIPCQSGYVVNEQVPELLEKLLVRECSHGFPSYFGLDKKLDNYYLTMVKFIQSF